MVEELSKVGRPRSEQARAAVLHAADDLLVEIGYSALTMKAVAERAGVSRMTVYRWWSTKAEILFEASLYDARHELAVARSGGSLTDLTAYLEALIAFLTGSDAGAAYRALIGEAQHDTAVAALLATEDVVNDSARSLLEFLRPDAPDNDFAAAQLVGPVFFWVLSGRDTDALVARELARTFLSGLGRTATG